MEKIKNNILISALFFLGCLLLASVLYYLIGIRLRERSISLIETKKDLALAEKRSRNVALEEELFAKINSNKQTIDALFVNSDEPIVLIKSWEELAAQCNISVKINASQIIASKDDAWKSVGFKITGSGSVANSLRFIEKLERSPYILEIQSVFIGHEEMMGNLGSVGENGLRFDLTIKVYSK